MAKAKDPDNASAKTSTKSMKSIKSLKAAATSTLKTIKRKAIDLVSPKKKQKKTRAISDVEDDTSNASDDESLASSRPLWKASVINELGEWKTLKPSDMTYCHESLANMMKSWTSPIYAFYKPTPSITYVGSCQCRIFKCTGRGCKFESWRYLDTKDKSSTGNLL